mgnify:CR=1 FL=1
MRITDEQKERTAYVNLILSRNIKRLISELVFAVVCFRFLSRSDICTAFPHRFQLFNTQLFIAIKIGIHLI